MGTQLLVSVRSAAEAEAAIAGGADFIDIKEPSRGSLGRPDDATAAAIVAAVAGRQPVSMALGELRDQPALPSVSGLQWCKVGLAGYGPGTWVDPFFELAEALLPVPLVPVLYGDAEHAQAAHPFLLYKELVATNIRYLLLDTYEKDGRNLLHWLPQPDLSGFAEQCREVFIQLGLAGALDAATIAELLPLRPALIAVRGAACMGNKRNATVCADKVRDLKTLIQP